jgi:arsenical pump membrane protein
VLLRKREAPWATLKGMSWSVLVLVAGLFVLVEALQYTGVVAQLTAVVQAAAQHSTAGAAWGVGIVIAIASNLINNLPMGLIAGDALNAVPIDPLVHAAATIAIDLGPNLSVTGSLATILWLTAIRREGTNVSAWVFLRYGMVVMPVALLLALAALLLPH